MRQYSFCPDRWFILTIRDGLAVGYLITAFYITWCTLFALAPPRPRSSSRSNLAFWFGYLFNEIPGVVFICLLLSTIEAFKQGIVFSPGGLIALVLSVVATVALAVIVWRAQKTPGVIQQALSRELGREWRPVNRSGSAPGLIRALIAPFYVGRFDVERIANISYGSAGKRNLLDVYRRRSRPSGCPVLIYMHGGGFRIGNKRLGANPLLYYLASRGWICISANYRIGRQAHFPDHLIDMKKVIAWVRQQGVGYGADPAQLFVSGSSAGGHIAAMAGLTQNDSAFQPGFEDIDTSVRAVISLYGYYGRISSRDSRPSTPTAYIHKDAPPFFVTHGDNDTLVIVEDAHHFVNALRSASLNPVVYAELPGAQHSFDLFHSLRNDAVIKGIEEFTMWVRSRPGNTSGKADRQVN